MGSLRRKFASVGGALSGVRAGFELDDSVDMESIFLQGMLSEKKPVGLLDDCEPPVQRETAGGVAMENEIPTDDDWDNL